MRKFIYLTVLCCLFSCNENDYLTNDEIKTTLTKETITVLQERNPNYPLEFPLKVQTRSNSSLLSETGNYLGYSYDLEHFPLGTALNIGSPIIDMAKLKAQEGSFYVDDYAIYHQDMNTFSYSTFDRYTYKSKDTEKITTGFKVNVGLFSFGNKRTVETIYTTDIANEKQRVFGQLDATVIGHKYNIATSSNLMKKIKLKYLHKTFIEEIHSITPYEFIEIYGPLVLTSYFTGGRLSAIYSGIYTSNDATEVKEKNMDADIKASYGSANLSDANIGIGSKYYREEMTSKKISNMQVSVKAIGGNLNYASFTSPQSLSNINIDLSKWMSSLTPETYGMIEIEDGGLMPLSEFVLEYNLKRHIERYLISGDFEGSPKYFQEPYIEILRREIQGFTFIIPILKTKSGDGIALGEMSAFNSGTPETTINETIERLKNEKAKIYGLKIVSRTYVSDIDPIIPNWTFDIGLMDRSENVFSKYIDEENNTLYLLYTNPNPMALNSPAFSQISTKIGNKKLVISKTNSSSFYESKIGWSFYDYKRALNLYGLTEFVNKLPEITIDREELLDYQLIAL